MFNTLLYQPILNTLLWLNGFTGNLGWAIILLTLGIRAILIPLTLPAMKAAVKMRDLQPEINKLKSKYKDDKAGLQQAQLALFQQHQINPAAGCLPYLVQFIILIALYRVFINYLQNGVGEQVNLQFFYLNLKNPDPFYILPLVAGLSQLILGLMIMPATSTAAEKTLAASTKSPKDDAQADNMTAMASSMQSQMAFMMPLMTAFLALRFPAGLTLYWIVSTILSIGQQYIVSGWGGLVRLKQYIPLGLKPKS